MRDEGQPKIDAPVGRYAFETIKKQERFGEAYDKVEQRFSVFAPACKALIVKKSREHHNPRQHKRAALQNRKRRTQKRDDDEYRNKDDARARRLSFRNFRAERKLSASVVRQTRVKTRQKAYRSDKARIERERYYKYRDKQYGKDCCKRDAKSMLKSAEYRKGRGHE